MPDSSQTITYDTPTPDEKKPDIEDETYVVAADLPRRITMDSVGINGFIQKVGVNDQNAMSVPTNIHVGGWFTDSVKPGEKGLSIIDGHVNGAYSGGIFVSLQRVAVGARFSIEFGDLTTKTFEVVSVQQVPEASSAELLFTKDTSIEAQLSLITCGGAFDSSSRTYEDRVIVKSKLIESSP